MAQRSCRYEDKEASLFVSPLPKGNASVLFVSGQLAVGAVWKVMYVEGKKKMQRGLLDGCGPE